MRRQRRHYKQITEEVYGQLKAMFNAGVPQKSIQALTHRSPQVLRWIRESEDYDGYRQCVRAHAEKYGRQQTVEEPTQMVIETEVSNHQLLQALEEMRSAIEELKGMMPRKRPSLF